MCRPDRGLKVPRATKVFALLCTFIVATAHPATERPMSEPTKSTPTFGELDPLQDYFSYEDYSQEVRIPPASDMDEYEIILPAVTLTESSTASPNGAVTSTVAPELLPPTSPETTVAPTYPTAPETTEPAAIPDIWSVTDPTKSSTSVPTTPKSTPATRSTVSATQASRTTTHDTPRSRPSWRLWSNTPGPSCSCYLERSICNFEGICEQLLWELGCRWEEKVLFVRLHPNGPYNPNVPDIQFIPDLANDPHYRIHTTWKPSFTNTDFWRSLRKITHHIKQQFHDIRRIARRLFTRLTAAWGW